VTQDEIIEMAIQGHASTRDSIRWAMNQEREACAKVCEDYGRAEEMQAIGNDFADAIRARGEA